MSARLWLAVAALVAAGTACGKMPSSAPSSSSSETSENVQLEPQEPADSVEVQNSGRMLSGVYVAEGTPASLTFQFDGTFSRTWPAQDGSRADSGTYVVGADGKLHLFVEQIGEARLAWARRVTFTLSGDPAATITLIASDGRSTTLARTGDAPPLASETPPAG